MEKEKLLGRNPQELSQIAKSLGMPSFAGSQIARWMYGAKVRSIEGMTNISRDGRAALAEKYELGLTLPLDCAISSDGTRKYLFPGGNDGEAVEAVMIPDGDRKTLCVSSQAGCKMGCRFCMTGRQGFHGNLDAASILSQFLAIDEAGALTNAVFMGMGEPFDNYGEVSRVLDVLTSDWGFGWSPKRVTVSSIGVLPVLKKYLDTARCHLAISLHNPFSDERAEFMPVEKAYPVAEVVELLRRYDFSGQRRVSFEYTMFGGWNDGKRHADALIRLLRGLECRVNLIRFHRIPDFPFDSSPQHVMEAFRDRLSNNGITCTIRASRGEDIFAACGLLAGRHGSLKKEDEA